MYKTITTFLLILFVLLTVIPGFINSNLRLYAINQSGGVKISNPGNYIGYSHPLYKEWVRSSQYVTVSDGTKIAVDIFRPSINGKPVAEPLPLIWTHTCYQRVMPIFIWRNDILHQFPWLRTVLKHGYIIAAADARGTGASFGIWQGCGSPEESQDAYDLTEWFAAQPWCNGKIGPLRVMEISLPILRMSIAGIVPTISLRV